MPTLTRNTANIIAGILALALVGGLVIRTSTAVFTAQTDNTGNSLAAGTIILTDDDGGVATLTMSNVAPGEYTENCIEVEYGGSLDPETVRVFSTTTESGSIPFNESVADFSDWVLVTIEQGDGTSTGGFGDCSGFSGGDLLVNAEPLSSFDTDHNSYATGLGSWDPALGPGQTRVYRIRLTLDLTTGNAYQGATLQDIDISWATQSRSSAQP